MIRGYKVDDLLSRIVSGGFAALCVKVMNAGLTYAMLVILARLLTPDEYGRFAFGFSLATAASVLPCLGLPVAALRYWPEYNVKKQIELARSFIARGFSAVVLASVVSTILLIAGALILTDAPGYGMPYFGAIAVLMMLMAVSEFVASSLRADGTIVAALAPRDVVWRILVIGYCGVVFFSGMAIDAETALQVSVICLLAVCVPQIVYAMRRMNVSPSDISGPTRIDDWSHTIWPMWGSAIVFVLIRQFDVILLGLFLSPEQTGDYFAALRTASLLTLMSMAGSMIAAPLISQLYHANDETALHQMCKMLILCIAIPTLFGFALMVVLGKWLLVQFDPAFASAYPLLIILSAGFTVSALSGPFSYFLQMVGRQREYLKITACVYATVICVQCIALPIFGVIGLALPSALGTCCAAFWSVRLLRRQEGFDPSVFGLAIPATKPTKLSAAQ